jgi:putative PIN family toxin of toxin-antitoxin system
VQIVLDTNIFINAIGVKSPHRWLWDAIRANYITLHLSNDIFFEYWEILERKTNREIAKNIMNYLVTAPSVKFVHPYLNWNLIDTDPDDNKFVDCAFCGGANCIVTYDAHFEVQREIQFPHISSAYSRRTKAIYGN